MFCGNCGNQAGEGSAFCTNCGKQVSGQAQAKSAAINSAASGVLKKKKMIVMAALACVVCFAVILIVNRGGEVNRDGELDGIWESTPSRFGSPIVFEISGNSFTSTETEEIMGLAIVSIITSGTFSINDDSIELVVRSADMDFERFLPHLTAQQRRGAREDLLEVQAQVVSEMEGAIAVFSFSRTENTFTMDGIRFTRVISGGR